MSKTSTPTRILLIGYRGTGKTTVAAVLAAKTGWPWIDTDSQIVSSAGCSIRELFDREGEEGFRQRETDILQNILAGDCPIIACGGGIVLRKENRQLLADGGKIVLLRASAETIYQRLQGDPQSFTLRPPLTALEQEAEIREILRQREVLYADCAALTVDTENKTAEKVAEEILAHLSIDTQGKT